MKRTKAWRQQVENRYVALVEPACSLLAGLRLSPNIVTVIGFVISVAAGILYGTGRFFSAGVCFLFAGVCDTLDGKLARQSDRASAFGAFLDSSLDRFGEIAIFSGLAFFYAAGQRPSGTMVLLSVLALSGSLMVSYTRARAEGLGLPCSVGLMQRPERMAFLIVGSLLAPLPLIGAVLFKAILATLAALAIFTAIQRMVHVSRSISR